MSAVTSTDAAVLLLLSYQAAYIRHVHHVHLHLSMVLLLQCHQQLSCSTVG
jgi:hypothetical protein